MFKAKHKMVLALTILTAVSAPSVQAVVFAEESNPGNAPLVGGGPGLLYNNTPSMRMLTVLGSPLLYAPMSSVTQFMTPKEGDADSVRIYQIKGSSGIKIPGILGTFEGVWTFARVGSSDVWFGEWDAENSAGDKVPNTHNVFYIGPGGLSGKRANVMNIDFSGPITYNIKSINNYSGAAAPSSVLTAHFGNSTASSVGDISFTNGNIVVGGGLSNLGAFTASNVSVASAGGTGGTLSGQFFENGAASVAGIVTFSDRNKNTAFGGVKNQ